MARIGRVVAGIVAGAWAVRLLQKAQAGGRAELDKAIRLLGRATEPGRGGAAFTSHAFLCSAARMRFEWTGDPADLRLAIESGRAALTGLGAGNPLRPAALGQLAVALIRQAEMSGGSLEEPIALLREAVAGSGAQARPLRWMSGTIRPMLLADLGRALITRSAGDPNPAELAEAAGLLREALAHADGPPEVQAAVLEALGSAQRHLFAATGDLKLLDDAVALVRRAVALTDPGHRDRPVRMLNLAAVLVLRHSVHGDDADLAEAAAGIAGMRTNTSVRAVHHARMLAGLGTVGEHLPPEERDGLVADLRAARDGGVQEDISSYALARLLLVRGQPGDRVEAIGVLRDLVGRPQPAADLLYAQHALATALAGLADATGEAQARDEAIALYRTIVKTTAPGRSETAERLWNLAVTLQDRHGATGVAEDHREAVDLWRRIAADDDAPAKLRLSAASGAAGAVAARSGLRAALPDYEQAVRLLPLAAWRGISSRSRESVLAESSGLAGDVAAATLAAGTPGEALRLLESGRGVWWQQRLTIVADEQRLRGALGEAGFATLQRLRAAFAELQ